MKKFYVITLLYILCIFQTNAQYITVWKTDNPGIIGNTSITIPATGNNYSIVWEEVNNPANSGTSIGSGLHTLTLPTAGTYQVSISPGSGSFTAITFANTGDRNKLLEIKQWGNIPWTTMEQAYDGCQNLTISATDTPNLQNVHSLSGMFYGCAALNAIPGIGNWDVSNVTNMSRMFHSAVKFNESVASWNVSNVSNMNSMFYQARAFNQPIENWDVSNVSNMGSMFCLATEFNQSLNEWNVSRATDMSFMFYGAGKFNQAVDRWNVKNVKNMASMFAAATSFNQSLGQWRIYSVTSMATMLVSTAMDCASMTQTLLGWAANPGTPDNITFGATGRNYGTQAVAARALLDNDKNWNMSIGFEITCTSPTKPYITVWKTDNGGVSNDNEILIPATGSNYNITWHETGNPANNGTATGTGNHLLTFSSPGIYQVSISPGSGTFTNVAFTNENDKNKLVEIKQWGNIQWDNMANAYQECSNLTITATDIPDLQDVTSMSGMFNGCSSITNIPEINRWDVSSVTDMQSTFAYASQFGAPLSNWDVSNVTSMVAMFQGATAFNHPIGNWNVGKVTSMFNMFDDASNFNQPIGEWNVSNVTDMYGMFSRASSFNQSLDGWDVSNVTDMGYMFSEAEMFDGSIGNWNVGNVTNMVLMFNQAIAFNRPIGSWDVRNVTDMSSMFDGCQNFDQLLNNWSVSRVTDMSSMFSGAVKFNKPLENWNTENVTDMSSMFSNAEAFNQPLANWNVSKVTNMFYMFFMAYSFNQPVDNWDVSKVGSFTSTFYNASSFNQSLSNWALTSVTDLSYMLSFSGMDCNNMAATLKGWAGNPLTPDNLVLGAEMITYGPSASTDLDFLRNSKNWTIEIGAEVECSPLEVSLISFNVKNMKDIVKLEWATASETDNDYFEIERSSNARSWHSIDRIRGAGTVNNVSYYSQVDTKPLKGMGYYRLKIVDLAGKAEYSNIRAVTIKGDSSPLIYPNPATTTLTISGTNQGIVTVYNMFGLPVMETEIKDEKTVIPIRELPVGTYLIKMHNGWNAKFVKY